jgi:hypothetical protein
LLIAFSTSSVVVLSIWQFFSDSISP